VQAYSPVTASNRRHDCRIRQHDVEPPELS
jgi:hypothetical protein